MKRCVARALAASFACVALLCAPLCAHAEDTAANQSQETIVDQSQETAEDQAASMPDDGLGDADGSDDVAALDAENPESLDASADNAKSGILGRSVVSINQGWNFSTNDTTLDGWGFPDGRSSGTVDLPHSWEYAHPTRSYIPAFNKKTVTYSKTIDVSSYQGRRLYLKFYGVSKNAGVLVDGKVVGSHVGGYSAFVVDITDAVQGKSQVELTVNVTNIDTDSIPINVDYTQWAGIYRDVELIATENQHFSLMNAGSQGVFFDYTLQGGNANVTVRADISNHGDKGSVTLKSQIFDANGNVVSEVEQPCSLAANKDFSEFSIKQKVTNVHRWNAVADPYLYTAVVQICGADGSVLDEVSQAIGFRTFKISKGSAYLNGVKIQIHGVGYHQDRQGCGNAVTADQISSDIDQMLDMGVNFVRASHYPHDQAFYELADQKGILVYNEIPYYMIYSKAKSYGDSINAQMVEMIRQNYNHPCVVMDGIQNEVVYNPSFKNYGLDFDVTAGEIIAFNKRLVALAKAEDPSRLVVQATIDSSSHAQNSKQWSSNIELTGLNLYVGFKSAVSSAGNEGRKELAKLLNAKLDSYKSIYGVDSLMISEYGAGANVQQHCEVDDGFSWDGKDSSNSHYEEYQSFIHEVYWDTIQKRSDLPVTSVWNMFDFSCYRNEGGVPRTNTKGLLCYDHETRKDAYYFYKANWNTDDPLVYLTSKRFLARNRSIEDFKVYSNCDKVKLYVNGSSVGYGTKQQSGVFVWRNVKLKQGVKNSVKAVGERGGATYEDSVDGITVPDHNVSYRAHVQNIGWQQDRQNGSIAGTVGKSLRIESLTASLDDPNSSIKINGHVQGIGWQGWKTGSCGTTGKSKRLEAIRVRLTGNLSNDYDIWYRVHSSNVGWLGWAKNGAPAGTTGKGYAAEAVQMVLVKKGDPAPGDTANSFIGEDCIVTYKAHVATIGWQPSVSDGATAGTTGRGLSMETLSAAVSSDPDALKLNAHVQNIGWQGWQTGNCGTTGKSLRMEAVKIKLTGDLEDKYDVYYRVHVANFGWLGWAKNGEAAGTQGYAYGMQAVEICLVEKGGKAPGKTGNSFRQPLVTYSAHVAHIGWMSAAKDGKIAGTTGRGLSMEALRLSLGDSVSGGIEAKAHVAGTGWESGWSTTVGTTGKSRAIEAVRIRLTGDAAKKYDVMYRAHSAKVGWSAWVKNGKKAGTTGYSLPMQAIEIKLVKK